MPSEDARDNMIGPDLPFAEGSDAAVRPLEAAIRASCSMLIAARSAVRDLAVIGVEALPKQR